MAGTATLRSVLYLASYSLAMFGTHYERRGTDLYHRGERPGDDWVGHGTFPRLLYILTLDGLKRVTLRKQRWKRKERLDGLPRTCHSRPPDDLASVWSCALIVALSMWSWLDADQGLHQYAAALPELDEHPSRRTVQRWTARGQRRAAWTEQSLRRAAIEECEPRPVEQLFDFGLSPPKRLVSAGWRSTDEVLQLRNGLRFLIETARTLEIPIPRLLAEARGRWHPKAEPFLI